MAEVYKAYHPGLDRYVAVKVLHPFLAQEEDFLTRFQREAKAVAALRHSNIVQVFDFDFDRDRNLYYMVMEFIDGRSLKVRLEQLIARGERMPLDEAVRIIADVGDALSYAHQRGMVHRDVKPANVMFNSDGHVILTDFGIAKMVNVTGLTASGAMVGTPAYISPEQGLGEAGDERSDIYSLGVMLYQLVTGVLPFDADTPMGVVFKHIREPLPSPRAIRPDLSQSVEDVIARAMAKNPDHRFQTVAEFVADLQRAARGEKIAWPSAEATAVMGAFDQTARVPSAAFSPDYGTPPPAYGTPPPQAVAPRRPWLRWLIIAAAALGFLAVVVVGGWFLFDRLLSGGVAQVSPTSAATSRPTPDASATHLAATEIAYAATVDAPTATPTLTPTPLPTDMPTPTPDLTATSRAACEFDAEVVEDPAAWPLVLAPGQAFTKRWVVRNSGTCPWEADFELALAGGDQLGGPGTVAAEPLAVDEEWEIALDLVAPTEYDTYSGSWQFQTGSGDVFGAPLEVSVEVGPTPTPLPPAATPTPEFTPTPRPLLEMSYPNLETCWVESSTGQWGGRIVWSAWGGPGPEYHYFYGAVASGQELEGPYDDFSSQTGRVHRMSYFSTSGAGVFWPLPDDCCPGPQGRWVSPDGYEVVWWTVEYSTANCP
jgi:hypothetical protein